MKKTLFVFADGGARGNPGPAAVGFLVKDNQGKVLVRQGKYIGRATNNVAEYMAVIEALGWLKKNLVGPNRSVDVIKFFLDSKLVVNQLSGVFKIKNKNLRDLVIKVRKLEQAVGGNTAYHYWSREKNKQADFLVNQALDEYNP
ncbi:MAG TPA: ribonuclease HI family protein [Nevskiaceae bacterium]|nr:ribonuclease HI family protein [Nevskiaceae bacterium]